MKRILVDMSVCLLHHGHIRLLKRAKELGGHVIVALTTDAEVLKHKGHMPELSYDERKEMLEALACVDEVVPSGWEIDDDFLKLHGADFLVHSGDNANPVSSLVSLERTEGVSSMDLRRRSLESIVVKRNTDKCLLTPGPANLHPENLYDIRPVFTRGDEEFERIRERTLARVLALAGQDSIVALPGSATTAIEVAMASFLQGSLVVVTSGYYSQRMLAMLQRLQPFAGFASVRAVPYRDFVASGSTPSSADWVVAAYTETADAFLADITAVSRTARAAGAKLFVDATGSINLEDNHELADVCAFSSCKGLGGLTGAGFITFNQSLLAGRHQAPSFVLDIETYVERKTTAPAHAICSLDSLSAQFAVMRQRVRQSKDAFVARFRKHVSQANQPALCTKVSGITLSAPPGVVMYTPRALAPGTQVICHLFDQFPSNREPGELYKSIEASAAGD